MSIEVNGLTFPDIPEDLPEQYPFVAIFEVTGSSATVYQLYATPGSMINYDNQVYGQFTDGYVVYQLDSSNSWLLAETSASGSATLPISICSPVAANYSIFYLSENGDIEDAGIVFKRNIWPVSIDPPSIPQDFIYSYPYAAVFKIYMDSIYFALFDNASPDEYVMYIAMLSSGKIYYVDVGNMYGLDSEDAGNISYGLDTDTVLWVEPSEVGTTISFVVDPTEFPMYVEFTPLWSNHNIETVTGVDDNGDLVFSDTYFEATETVTPIDYYTVSRLQLLAVAQQARRHNDFSTAPLTIEEMVPILSNVSILDDVSEVAF